MAIPFFAGMLDSDEDGLPVGTPGEACNFAFLRPHKETLDLSGFRVGEQHLVAAHSGEDKEASLQTADHVI
nr:hypothetical protein [Sneathiella sedimenti]